VSDGFLVDYGALAAHVAAIDAIAERTRRAADTAQPLRRDAYGLVGQVFAGVADDASRTASRAVTELAESVRRHAEGVRTVRDACVAVERAIAEGFGGLR
jgi:hypothetical protein